MGLKIGVNRWGLRAVPHLVIFKKYAFSDFDLSVNFLKRGPIGRNSIVKNSENFSERNAKNSAKKFLTVTKKWLKKQKN